MATKPRVKKETAVASAVQAAHSALIAILSTYQDQTAANVVASESRSKLECATLITLWTASVDRAADCIALLGDGQKSTKKVDGVKGSVVDALVKQYADKLHVNVRSEVHKMRTVFQHLHIPAVREAAEKRGLRAAYDTAKPKAAAEVAAAPAVAPVGSAMDRVTAILSEEGGFDAAIAALRSYFVKAADSIGLSKLGEVEVHLMSKTKKQA